MEMNQPQFGLVEKPYVTVIVPVYNEEVGGDREPRINPGKQNLE